MAKNHAAKNRIGPKASYKMAFACFSCRKTFKRPYVEGEWSQPCAECKEVAFNMGRHFRSPPREDKLKWQIIEYITRVGEWGRFRAANHMPIPFPRTMKGAKLFVEQIEKERILRKQIEREHELELERKRSARKKRAAIRRKMPLPGKLKRR